MARRDALQLGLNRKDGSGHVLGAAAGDLADGVLGSLASMITVDPGFEAAVAAALGSASDAVVVRDQQAAAAAVRLLRATTPAVPRCCWPAPRPGPRRRWPMRFRPMHQPAAARFPRARAGLWILWILCRLRHRTPPACRCPPCWPASPSSRTWMPRRS